MNCGMLTPGNQDGPIYSSVASGVGVISDFVRALSARVA